MSGRIPCVIPGCRRTFLDDGGGETICGRHWRSVDVKLRSRFKRTRARFRKINRLSRRKAILARGTARLDRAWFHNWAIHDRLWRAIVEDATIKAALGADRLFEPPPRRRRPAHVASQ